SAMLTPPIPTFQLLSITLSSTNLRPSDSFSFFFFNDTATTEIYTLSLHDALPICQHPGADREPTPGGEIVGQGQLVARAADVVADRKSTRLNSSHDQISYAVFCLKKKKKKDRRAPLQEHSQRRSQQ